MKYKLKARNGIYYPIKWDYWSVRANGLSKELCMLVNEELRLNIFSKQPILSNLLRKANGPIPNHEV